MRYVLAMLMTLGIGVMAATPVALAQGVNAPPNGSFINQYGNQIVPMAPGGGGGGGGCYMDGVAYSCTQPAKVTFPNPNLGTVAGPTEPSRPGTFYGGDRN